MSNATEDGRARKPDHVVYQYFDNETILLNLETGQYHGLNASGGQVLDNLLRMGNVQYAAEALAEQYEQPYAEVARDVNAFCTELVEQGLIEISTAGDSAPE